MRKLVIFLILFAIYGNVYGFDYNMTKDVIAYSTPTQMDQGVSLTDLDYNTTFWRVSTATSPLQGNNTVAVPVYSRFPISNSSGEYLYIQKPAGNPDALLYSATNYTFISTFPATITIDGTPGQSFNTQETSELRWDYTGNHPNMMYYVAGMKFLKYDVILETATVIHDFAVEYSTSFNIENDVEGDSSADSRYWAFIVKQPYDGNTFPVHRIITYDKNTDTILGTLGPSMFDVWPSSMPTPNMVEISPKGTKVITHYTRGNYAGSVTEDYLGTYLDAPHAWELDFSTSPIAPIKVSTDATHSGWAWDEDGNELFVSQNNRNDWIEAERIDQDTQFSILAHADLGIGNGMHFARMTEFTTSWILFSTYKSTFSAYPTPAWGDNELIMLEVVDKDVRTPRVWRLGHMHNYYNDYYSEGFAPISLDNTKLWWGARWPLEADIIDTYQMDLPPAWVADLQYEEPAEPTAISSMTFQRGVDGYSDAYSCFIDPSFALNSNDTSDNPSWRFNYTTLLYFGIDDIPADITITSATLRMYVTDVFTGADIACGFIENPDSSTFTWRVNQSTGQVFNQFATWDYKDDAISLDWSSGDSNSFLDVKGTTITVTNVSGTGWKKWAITDLVSDWYDGDEDNQGIWMVENVSNSSNVKYYSAQHVADPTKRPLLYIEYETAASTAGQTIFGIESIGYNTRGDMWLR